MKSLTFALAFIATLSAPYASALDIWTCHLNAQATQISLDHNRAAGDTDDNVLVTHVSEFQLQLFMSELVGGYIKSSLLPGEGIWDLSKDGPESHSRFGFAYFLRKVRISPNGDIVTGFDLDGWDHYHDAIRLNPDLGTAGINEEIIFDGDYQKQALGVFDCQLSH